jgi:hypothetical protein
MVTIPDIKINMDIEFGIKRFNFFFMVSGSNPVVAYMMVTGGLYGR